MKCKTIGLLFLAMVTASTASAGVLATDLNAIEEFRGSVNLSEDWSGFPFFFGEGYWINADVDYAVYARNEGDSYFDMTFGTGADPSDGADFVYAYQVFNLASLSQPIWSFTVGMDGNEYAPTVVPEFIGYVGGYGVAPNGSRFVPADGSIPPHSARWDYDASPHLPVDQASTILFFTCPSGPEWDNGTVKSGSPKLMSAKDSVPSPTEAVPIPEPMTMALFGLSAFGLCVRKRRVR